MDLSEVANVSWALAVETVDDPQLRDELALGVQRCMYEFKRKDHAVGGLEPTKDSMVINRSLTSLGRFGYPLVNVYITLENHHFEWENQLFRLGHFYVTMLNYQRVDDMEVCHDPLAVAVGFLRTCSGVGKCPMTWEYKGHHQT